MSARTDTILGTLLTVALGIVGALLLAHWAACEQYEGFCAMAVLLTRPAKLLPIGCGQQRRYATRAERFEQWPDTIATNWGSADAVGDDQAERSSNWGAIDESAAPEGGRHREPSKTTQAGSGLLASLLWPLGVVLAIASAALYLR